jgi:type III restriction enzyme
VSRRSITASRPADKSNMAKYLFGGFQKCLYPVQKFDSDAERRLAGILERDAIKWFKPAKGQFQMFYRDGADHLEYVPDFVAETETTIYMLEPKASNQMWRYLLIPHDAIAENHTLAGLAARFGG